MRGMPVTGDTIMGLQAVSAELTRVGPTDLSGITTTLTAGTHTITVQAKPNPRSDDRYAVNNLSVDADNITAVLLSD